MIKIPLVDLQRQYRTIQSDVDAAIRRVIERGTFILGEDVRQFEENFARACGVPYGVGTSSGTSALHLALAGLGIGSGDEVITVPNTFIATTEAISQTGAKVVFVDVDEKTYNMDPVLFEKAITAKTKAVIPVHLYGQSADMDAIVSIARKRKIKIIEDASQAHLAEFNGRRVGSFGDCACFSFFPGKNLGAFGDAGMVVTSDEDLAARMRMLGNHGRTNKYEHLVEGFNYRLDTLQAAVLNVKLKYLEDWTQSRRRIAQIYDLRLNVCDLSTPYIDARARSAYHLYVIRLRDRVRLERIFASQGIATGVHYPVPLHLQKAYAYLKYPRGAFPVTELCSQEILSLPIFPEMTDEELESVVAILRRELNRNPVERKPAHV